MKFTTQNEYLKKRIEVKYPKYYDKNYVDLEINYENKYFRAKVKNAKHVKFYYSIYVEKEVFESNDIELLNLLEQLTILKVIEEKELFRIEKMNKNLLERLDKDLHSNLNKTNKYGEKILMNQIKVMRRHTYNNNLEHIKSEIESTCNKLKDKGYEIFYVSKYIENNN